MAPSNSNFQNNGSGTLSMSSSISTRSSAHGDPKSKTKQKMNSSCSARAGLYVFLFRFRPSQGRTTLDLEFLQRPQCSLFPSAKIQDKRVHHRPARGKNTGRNRVCWSLVPTTVHNSPCCSGKSSESMVSAHFTGCWATLVSLVFSGCMFSLATLHSHSRSWRT